MIWFKVLSIGVVLSTEVFGFKYLEWVFFIYDDEMVKNEFGLMIM